MPHPAWVKRCIQTETKHDGAAEQKQKEASQAWKGKLSAFYNHDTQLPAWLKPQGQAS